MADFTFMVENDLEVSLLNYKLLRLCSDPGFVEGKRNGNGKAWEMRGSEFHALACLCWENEKEMDRGFIVSSNFSPSINGAHCI